ncbi:hypothetical protein IKG20_02215 [Candidatus Saccharibacteria bacterium]|nr:hypothetical protein [Candidatus Saccharibacteria bacterium]
MPENKQPNPSSRRHRPVYQNPLFWIIIAIAIAGATFAIIHFSNKPGDGDSETSIVPIDTKPEEVSPKITPTDSSTTKTDSASETDGKTPTKYDGDDPNLSESLTGSFTTARFSNDKLILRVNIDQYLSSGTCTLEIVGSDQTVSKTANLVPSASTSTCEGFDVPADELTNFSRPLTVRIKLSSGDKSGLIESEVE